LIADSNAEILRVRKRLSSAIKTLPDNNWFWPKGRAE
jgi:hypothetical protein